MARFAVAVLLLGLWGCAASGQRQQAAAPPQYQDAPAVSLVFDPPAALDQPPMLLPREPRQPAAFVGFEDLTATFFYIRQDDRQMSWRDHGVFREAVSERVGVSYR